MTYFCRAATISLILIEFAYRLPAQIQLTKDLVDKYSTASCFVTEYNRFRKPIYTATGFIIQVKSVRYLITNNHVVGGKYAQDEHLLFYKSPIPSDSIPEFLTVRLYGQQVGTSGDITLPLNDGNGHTWIPFFENESDTSTLLDVVAIPLSVFPVSYFSYTTLLTENDLNPRLFLYPAAELFVVGYPYALSQLFIYPIWKRGTIASEFELLQMGQSIFYIDATTRAGMSGSPVYFRSEQIVTQSGSMISNGLHTFLVGIYSAQNGGAELGKVTRLEKVFTKLSQWNP